MSSRIELLAGNEPQHPDRVVGRLPPQGVIELAEDFASFGVPAPPEVLGQLVEAIDAFGQGGQLS